MAAPLKFNQLLDSFAGPQLRRDVSAALFAAADDVRARSRRSITAGSVGGVNHVPSAPGEPPNNDTGFLVASHETAMPVLLKKYLLLNARIIGFNRDPRFNDALDGLMVLDLTKLPERTVEDLRKGMEVA